MKFFTPELYEFCYTAWHSCPEDEEWQQAWAEACERFGQDRAELDKQVLDSGIDPSAAYDELGRTASSAAHARYKQHLEAINHRLPPDLAPVSDASSVDDALIAKLRRRDRDSLQLVLRCGNLQIGYFDLDFRYSDISMSEAELNRLAELALAHRGSKAYGSRDCWYHEIDALEDGHFEHRLLFHAGSASHDWREHVPETAVTIRCRSMSVKRIERPNRQLPPFPQRARI